MSLIYFIFFPSSKRSTCVWNIGCYDLGIVMKVWRNIHTIKKARLSNHVRILYNSIEHWYWMKIVIWNSWSANIRFQKYFYWCNLCTAWVATFKETYCINEYEHHPIKLIEYEKLIIPNMITLGLWINLGIIFYIHKLKYF